MKNTVATIGLLFLTSLATWAQKGELTLKNGEVIKGKVVNKTVKGAVIFESEDGQEYRYEQKELKRFKPYRNMEKGHRRKGYIGIRMGPSFPLGDFSDKSIGRAGTGLHLTLVDFGFLFNDYVGICANWFGGANPTDYYDHSNHEAVWSYGGMMVGPLASLALSPKVEIDLKPMIGYCITTPHGGTWQNAQDPAFAYAMNMALRYHLGRSVSLIATTGYFSTRPTSRKWWIQEIETINASVGVAFRLGN